MSDSNVPPPLPPEHIQFGADDDTVWSAVNEWIAGIVKVTTIRQWQGGPMPTFPYCVTNLVGSQPVRVWHRDWFGEEDSLSGRVMLHPILDMEWNFSIHAYGEKPMNVLRPLVTAKLLSQVEETLFPALVLHEMSQIRNLSEYHNEDWEPHAQVDMSWHGIIFDGHLVDTIETYEKITIIRR